MLISAISDLILSAFLRPHDLKWSWRLNSLNLCKATIWTVEADNIPGEFSFSSYYHGIPFNFSEITEFISRVGISSKGTSLESRIYHQASLNTKFCVLLSLDIIFKNLLKEFRSSMKVVILCTWRITVKFLDIFTTVFMLPISLFIVYLDFLNATANTWNCSCYCQELS